METDPKTGPHYPDFQSDSQDPKTDLEIPLHRIKANPFDSQ